MSMSDTARKIYSWNLRGFNLEFDIEMEESVGGTRMFGTRAPEDFVYAAGSIWVRQNDSRYLVRAYNSENLAEWMSAVVLRLRASPPISPNVLASIGFNICQWFVGYWDRVTLETADASDEEIYNYLSPYCLISEDNGCMAVFSAHDMIIVQICAQQSTLARPLCFETHLQASEAASGIAELSACMALDVRSRSKEH
jgi:hypothetical protein